MVASVFDEPCAPGALAQWSVARLPCIVVRDVAIAWPDSIDVGSYEDSLDATTAGIVHLSSLMASKERIWRYWTGKKGRGRPHSSAPAEDPILARALLSKHWHEHRLDTPYPHSSRLCPVELSYKRMPFFANP